MRKNFTFQGLRLLLLSVFMVAGCAAPAAPATSEEAGVATTEKIKLSLWYTTPQGGDA